MTYSNGYNVDAVLPALVGRVGWRQPIGGPALTAANRLNKGRVFQDFHALVTVDNVKATMEEAAASDDNLNAYLTTLETAAIMRCLNGVFNDPAEIEQTVLFNALKGQLVNNTNLFCGIKITPAKKIDLAIQIDSVALYFNQAITFNLYLFSDTQETFVKEISVTSAANRKVIVLIPDLFLNYLDSYGSSFYLGYFQADIGTARAVNEIGDRNKGYGFRWEFIQSLKQGINFDRGNVLFENSTYGINFVVSHFKDHTNWVVKKASQFDELIGLQMAWMVLEQIIYAVRSNRTERILKDQVDRVGLMLEMQGAGPISDSPQITGLNKRIEREMIRVKTSFFQQPKAAVYELCYS